MNRRGPYLFVVLLLLLAGIALSVLRHNTYRVPYLPGAQQNVWQVDAKVEFEADDGPVQVVLTLPEPQNGFRLSDEDTASPGYGFFIEQVGSQRQARWSKRDADGDQTLFYKLEIIEDPNFQVPDSASPPDLRTITWDEPYRTAVNTLLQASRPQSADGYTLARQLLQRMNTQPLDQNSSLLLGNWSLTELLPRMLVSAGVPARTIAVLDLEDQRRLSLIHI